MNSASIHRSTGADQLRGWVCAFAVLAAVAAGSFLAQRFGGRPAMALENGVGGGSKEVIERGRYLVTIGGCNDCHTPMKMTEKGPQPDMDRMLSGHPEQMKLPPAPKAAGPWIWHGAGTNTAFAGPWGVSYAANLTSDKNTGLGIWTREMFVSAMRTGKHWGQASSRSILPPMPWRNCAQLTDDDLNSMFAYLQSVPPVANHVPDCQLPE